VTRDPIFPGLKYSGIPASSSCPLVKVLFIIPADLTWAASSRIGAGQPPIFDLAA
jgi:hypothetical protein